MKTSEKILGFVLIILVAILVWVTRCPQTQGNNGASNSALVAYQGTINSQATEIASLRAQLAACQGKNVVATAPAPVVYTPAPVQKGATNTQERNTSRVVTIIPEQIPLDEEVNIRDESFSSGDKAVDDGQIYTLPLNFYEPGVKGVKLCLRFGGRDNRYWPHIGILDGSMKVDSNIEGNGEKGYNFLLPGAVSTMKGDIGIRKDDLMFFVSATIIDKYMIPADNGIVEIKAPGTNWKAMPLTRFGEYYVCRLN